MLDEIGTRKEAEQYIDSVLDNPEYYNFSSDEERETLRQGRLRDWEDAQQHREQDGATLHNHIAENWNEDEFKSSFKNYDELNIFEKAFIKAVQFFDKDADFDPSITRESLLDEVITEARELMPDINTGSPTTDRLKAYQQALENTELDYTFSANDVFMYVERGKQPATQRAAYDENLLAVAMES